MSDKKKKTLCKTHVRKFLKDYDDCRMDALAEFASHFNFAVSVDMMPKELQPNITENKNALDPK